MNPPELTPSYSRDLWDYLPDMKHMPSRRDRDALVAQSHSDRGKKNRVRLWDYFFRVNPQDVGLPQKAEVARLGSQLADARARYERGAQKKAQELDGLHHSLARVREEIGGAAARLEGEARQKTLRARSRNQVLGIGSLGVAALAFVVGFLSAAWLTGTAGGFISFFLFCAGPVIFIALILAATFLLPLRRDPEERVKLLAETQKATQLPRLQAQESECVNRLAYASQQCQADADSFNSYAQQCATRVNWLHGEIDDLVRQIPEPPTAHEVEAWFLEDVSRLREVAINSRGLSDRLIEILEVPNPICIHAPLELQQEEKIPPPYRAGGTDRNKHMRARKFALKPDGTLLDFYGAYNFDYVLVAKDLLFTYGTTWDFITGEQSGDRGDEINYTKITAIRTARSYREIQTEDGKGEMENSPSLTLNLENGQSHVVNFPNLDYLRLTNAPPFDPDKWEFDQADAVENTIKVISEQKRIAQTLR